ncbi:hypothetical protein EGW08_005646, partial [Elysia chlorotica]
GLISNIINIVIFLKAGVKDNVTTLLLSLALSDLVFIALITPSACALVILNFAKYWPWPFDGMFLYFLPYWPAFTAYDLSAFISVALGVMRCACVAMPLKFKVVFTRTRTIRFVLFLVVLAVSLRVPVLTIFRVMHRADPVTNSSVLHVVAVNRKAMSRINDVMNRGVIIWVKYAIMVSCVGILSFKLAQASRIRRSCTETASQAGEKNTKEGLAPKDLQVIKSVVLVCTIFILSQLPFLLSSTARLITPQYTSNGQMRYLYNSISTISLFCSYLNASINIFVYYNFNSKYRFVFL